MLCHAKDVLTLLDLSSHDPGVREPSLSGGQASGNETPRRILLRMAGRNPEESFGSARGAADVVMCCVAKACLRDIFAVAPQTPRHVGRLLYWVSFLAIP